VEALTLSPKTGKRASATFRIDNQLKGGVFVVDAIYGMKGGNAGHLIFCFGGGQNIFMLSTKRHPQKAGFQAIINDVISLISVI